MNRPNISRFTRTFIALVGSVVINGCASFSIDESLSTTSQNIADFSNVELILKRSKNENEHANALVDRLLEQPLGQAEAVQLALANSADFQAVLANNWASGAQAAQTGRIPNPVLTLEDLTVGAETEIAQALSFGLLDVVTLPLRQRATKKRLEVAQLQLTTDVVDHITGIRQAWVRAVAAEQRHIYARQVFESAEAGAELAERMETVGNFSRLDRARQQSFYTDAATQLSASNHNNLAAKEALIRILGLNDEQVAKLKLPERLPSLPISPRSIDSISEKAIKDRLDIKLASASLNSISRAQGLGDIFSYTDIEFGAIQQTIKDNGAKESGDGYELEIKLPIFDWGGAKRTSMNAQTLAATNVLEATLRNAISGLRESYSAYRTAYDVARFYRDEVLPLQDVISEENVLRYNGMLISVFELLADSRRQISIVLNAIDAEEQFWLADAAMRSSIIGKPISVNVSVADNGMGGGEAGH